MNRCSPWIAPLAAALLLSACGGETEPGGSLGSGEFPADPYITQASDSGKLTIELRTSPDQPPQRGVTKVQLTIADKQGEPATDLVIKAVPWMPDMGHGASVEPTVKDEGEGVYEIDNVNMFMSGHWELRTEITGPFDDSAKFDFQIP